MILWQNNSSSKAALKLCIGCTNPFLLNALLSWENVKRDVRNSNAHHLDNVLGGATFHILFMFSGFPLSRSGLPLASDLLSHAWSEPSGFFWNEPQNLEQNRLTLRSPFVVILILRCNCGRFSFRKLSQFVSFETALFVEVVVPCY